MNTGHKSLDTRSRLIQTAIRLISNARTTSEITIRKIVATAGVNLNAVNYHFGSKENLIMEAVREIIGQYFQGRQIQPGSTGLSIYANLARICDFLFDEPVAARLALETELGVQGLGASLTTETLEFFLGLLRLALPGYEEGEIRHRVWIILATIHQLVLRPAGCKEWLGLDSSKKSARDAFLRHLCITLGVAEQKE
jgi:AcrR family transcriptional regulator